MSTCCPHSLRILKALAAGDTPDDWSHDVPWTGCDCELYADQGDGTCDCGHGEDRHEDGMHACHAPDPTWVEHAQQLLAQEWALCQHVSCHGGEAR